MNLNHIRVFVQVAKVNNFSEAARQLNLPKSQVSRQVRLLEESLGVRLFERTTRNVRLTDSGQMYFQRITTSLQDLEDANKFISGMQKDLNGLIRITAPVDLGPHVLSELVSNFLKEHPKLEIELNCTQRSVNLIEEQYDLGIRISRSLSDSSLIARKLADVSSGLFVSSTFISNHTLPAHPQEMSGMPGVLFQPNRNPREVKLSLNGEEILLPLKCRLKSDDFNSVLHSIRTGIGIGMLPYFIALPFLQTGELQILFPEWSLPQTSAYVVYPSKRFLASKVQILIDYLMEHFPKRAKCTNES